MLAAIDHAHSMLMTMSAAIGGGAVLIVIAHRLGLPAIVLVLLGGILMGPEGVGLVDPGSLGDGLQVIVSLSIGLILFEGGLTLDVSGYRTAPRMIKRLLTVGVLITWFGSALVLFLLVGLPTEHAIVAASLVIVTGPTVIAPLLKRIKVVTKVHNILHWEGVLIDPIGVFIALLCFEWVIEQSGQAALLALVIRVAWGLAVGLVGGLVLVFVVRRKLVPEDLVNVFALGFAVLIFALADAVQSEAGLLAVTVAGFVFGLTGSARRLKQLRTFKAEITDLLIGMLFILLAARLSLDQFKTFGLPGAAAVATVILVIRPLSIFVCSLGLDLTGRERAFLSWVAPRGIVAASMASLVAISLERAGRVEDPRFVETFTYSVIISTIVLQGLTAGPVAKLLGLQRSVPTGWLIVGAHRFGQRLARFLSETAGLQAILVDTNGRAVREAGADGCQAMVADARDPLLATRPGFQGIGNLLALTDNEDLNVRLCQSWSESLGEDHVFRCNPTGIEEPDGDEARDGAVLWPKLPRPSLVAGELQRGEAMLRVGRGDEPSMQHKATPLAWFVDGKLHLGATAPESWERSDQDRVLYLQREADYLLRGLRPEMVVELSAETPRELFEKLIDLVVGLLPNVPRDATVEELVNRESAFPTALGYGVAVPHAYCDAINQRLCVVAHVRGGIEFGAHDGELVRLVFLLLSPQGDPEGHLATLAEIARVMIDPSLREQLMETADPLQFIRIIRDSSQGEAT